MKNILVNIWMITYNHESFIAEAIESVLMQQTNFDYQLIIGEDCSTDGTKEIVKEYTQKYPDKIKTIFHNQNVGARKNSKLTYKECKAKYIAILEGDDYWTDPNKLQKQVDFLDANPNYAICIHESLDLFSDGNSVMHNNILTNTTFTTKDLAKQNFISTGSCVFRNNLIEKIPDWLEKVPATDWALHFLNSQFGDIYYMKDCMSVYRKHDNGAWSRLSNNEAILIGLQSMIEIDKGTNYQYHVEFIEGINQRIKKIETKEIKRLLAKNESLAEELNSYLDNPIDLEKTKENNLESIKYKAIIENDPFLDPPLSIENMDRYFIRNSILKEINDVLPELNGVLLDLGCGEMPYRDYIISNSTISKYLGLDIENPLYQKTVKPDMFWDGTKIPLPDNFVDSVMATEVFEHVPILEEVLKEILRVLKPGGILFFTVPYIWPLHDAPHDEYRYTPYSLERHFRNVGFNEVNLKPMGNWNSSLAQMLGLWLRRAPMPEDEREQLSEQLFPFYQQLISAGAGNSDFNSTTMFIGMCGLVKKENLEEITENITQNTQSENSENNEFNNKLSVLAIVCPQVGAASETFIRKHIDLISPDKTVVLTGNVLNEDWFHGPIKIIPIEIGEYSFEQKFEEEVIQFFIDNSVTHILCEFGCIGGAVLKMNERSLKLPSYVHFHGQDSSEFLRRKEIVKYYEWMGKVVDGIIAVSKPMVKRLIDIGLPKEKLQLIHSGVDVDKEVLSQPENEPCRLISVSRLVPKKGIFFVLKAMDLASKTFKNITLDIVGDGPLKPEIDQYIKDNNLTDVVKVHGQQSHKYVLDLMDNSSIFIQHSITDPETGNKEGLPITILESAAHALPIISTFHEGIPEAVEHNVTGLLVNEGEWELMSEYIIKLAADSSLRKQMGLAGRDKILSGGFTVPAMINELRSFMELNKNYNNISLLEKNSHNVQINRVLYINHNLYPFEISGTPISTFNHAVGMHGKGKDVGVLIPSPEVKAGFDKQVQENFILYKLPRLDKYEVFLGDVENNIMTEYLASFEKIIDEFEPDIVHINDYVYMPENIIPLLYDKGILVVRNVCNLEEICHMDYPVISNGLEGKLCSGPETYEKCAECYIVNKLGENKKDINTDEIKQFSAKIQKRFDSIKTIYDKNVDGIIFTENSFKNYFNEFVNFPQNIATIIPRGIKFDFERTHKTKMVETNKIHFAFIGHLMFSKGIDVVLKAFEQMAETDNFHLDIYGGVVDHCYLDWVKEMEFKFPSKIKYHGIFDKNDIAQIANSIDVAIVPSHFDTYNRVVREFLYLGIPIIATTFFGSSIIKDSVNGLKIKVGDYQGLAAAMKQLIENTNLVVNLFEGVRKTNIPMLSSEVDGIASFYSDLVEKDSERLHLFQKRKNNINKSSLKLIAIYLPQYHPISENDEAWGKGFTEWTNVSKAKPLYPSHYQPHVPVGNNYYDLRSDEIRKEQIDLAKEYGIEGFCYYYYWFNGKQVLETPITKLLKNKDLDFPFCICWANENWTKRWDGNDKDIIIPQDHNFEDDYNFIHSLFPFFADERYITINDKPVVVIYRTELFPDIKKTSEIWREEARKAGYKGIYLVRVEGFERNVDPADIGFDASMEFAPDFHELGENLNENGNLHSNLDELGVYSYKTMMENMIKRESPSYKMFRSVTPAWDNTPRKGASGLIIENSSAEDYEYWLTKAINYTEKNRDGEEKIVFINAWNEWGEGNHLEPDEKNGYNYLKKTKRALSHSATKFSLLRSAENSIQNEEYSDAKKSLDIILTNDPKDIEALIDYSIVNIYENDFQNAICKIETVLEIDTNNEIALENLQYISENSEIGEISQINELNNIKAEKYNKLIEAEKLIESNNYDEATKLLDELLLENPKNIDALNDLFVIAVLKKEYSVAEMLIDRVIDIDPKNEIAKGNYIYLIENQKIKKNNNSDIVICENNLNKINHVEKLIENNQLEDARFILNELIVSDPLNTDILNNFSVVYILTDKLEKAINMINRVLELDPQNEIALENFQYLKENYNADISGILNEKKKNSLGKPKLTIGLILATRHSPGYNSFVPLGLGYLEKNISKSLKGVKVIFAEVLEELLQAKPDLIGISATTENYHIAIKYALEIKKKLGIPVILGGIHISLLPKSLHDCFDLAVLGEGEITLVEVLREYIKDSRFSVNKMKEIPGLLFRENGSLVQTANRQVVSNLDSLPKPSIDELPFYNPRMVGCIVSARGCPYKCSFCASEKFAHHYRSLSTELIVDEIEFMVRKKNIGHIVFYDDLLIANKKKVIELVAKLEERKLLGQCSFSCQVRANLIDDEICVLLNKLNVLDVGIGIESFSDRILEYYNKKGVSSYINQKAIDLLHKYGIKVNPSIILGAPIETKEDILMTLRAVFSNMRDLKISSPAWGTLRPYPGTKIWDFAESIGIVSEDMDWDRFSDWSNFETFLCQEVPKEEFYEIIDEWITKISILTKHRPGVEGNFVIKDSQKLLEKIKLFQNKLREREIPDLGDELILEYNI